ncbi:ubiquitin carboxyl-terminal hydrolase family protein [Ceratocystis lukuohia]|uniref:Ubiquitin carboxyl-terminal hydrolase family protein n=1 Tax=Ceratocystis lukuohia TaxID=2019550 RepID=A0ABR4MUQ0_9PEZI
MPLPSSRAFLSSLISSIPGPLPTQLEAVYDIEAVAQARRSLLSTLHVIFPSLLLPALDLIDRGFVVRILMKTMPAEAEAEAEAIIVAETTTTTAAQTQARRLPGFLVYSATTPSTHFHGHRKRASTAAGLSGTIASIGGKVHLVSLTAWNCSCPSFAYDAFASHCHSDRNDSDEENKQEYVGEKSGNGGQYSQNSVGCGARVAGERVSGDVFGGLTRGSAPPCCKHILACLLAERCNLTDEEIPEWTLTREQLAGLVYEAA